MTATNTQLQEARERYDRWLPHIQDAGADFQTLHMLLGACLGEIERLRKAISIAANTCEDVLCKGRFSPAVDPVKWVEQLYDHLVEAQS